MEQQTPAVKKATIKDILLLQAAVILFAGSSVMSKYAAGYPLISWGFVLFYGLTLLLLGIYAIFWQQFLTKIPLNTAYANRAMSMLWTMLFGALLFSETITWNMIVGVIIIGAGILMVVQADAE